MTSRWLEIGDRVFVRRYRFYDQGIVAVLGGDAALVVDTRTTLVQAREILDDLGDLGSPRVGIVVNTHGHYDHVFGNAVFRPAVIWGHERCRTMIEMTGAVQREGVRADLRPSLTSWRRSCPTRPTASSPMPPPSILADARSGSHTSAAVTRTTTSWSRSPTPTSCARATCSRTGRRPGSGTATRWTGRRPPNGSWR